MFSVSCKTGSNKRELRIARNKKVGWGWKGCVNEERQEMDNRAKDEDHKPVQQIVLKHCRKQQRPQ